MRRVPFVTIAILLVLGIAFAAELLFPVDATSEFGSPGIMTLVAFGGSSRDLVVDGHQWWRLFTAPLLHGGVLHIALNGIALFMAGAVLEEMFGRAWLLALFAIGGLGGSLLSIVVNDANVVSVGASGAIMGLLAAALLSTTKMPEGQTRNLVISNLGRVFIPSLLPIFGQVTSGEHVDYGAHVGGAIAGGLAGLFLLATWPAGGFAPRFKALAVGVAALGIAAPAAGFAFVQHEFSDYTLGMQLIPEAEAPHDKDTWDAQADALAEKYPKDPRPHYYLGLKLGDGGDLAGAERELTFALNERDVLAHEFKPAFEVAIREGLVAVLLDEKKEDQAKAIALPACASASRWLAETKLCP